MEGIFTRVTAVRTNIHNKSRGENLQKARLINLISIRFIFTSAQISRPTNVEHPSQLRRGPHAPNEDGYT